jgi:hypothetical protein
MLSKNVCKKFFCMITAKHNTWNEMFEQSLLTTVLESNNWLQCVNIYVLCRMKLVSLRGSLFFSMQRFIFCIDDLRNIWWDAGKKSKQALSAEHACVPCEFGECNFVEVLPKQWASLFFFAYIQHNLITKLRKKRWLLSLTKRAADILFYMYLMRVNNGW